MTLVQSQWNPNLANCSYSSLSSNNIFRNMALDCTIHSLVSLGFLTVEKGVQLSKHINEINYERRAKGLPVEGTNVPSITNYLGNYLNKFVSIQWLGNLENVKKFLFKNLQIGNATMLSFSRDNNSGHTILVYRPNESTLICADIQIGIQFSINDLARHEGHKIIDAAVYISEDINQQANMEIDNPEEQLVRGGKYKKIINKKHKFKKLKTKKSRTKKSKTKKLRTKN
jgi:hypothetical protein